MGEHMDDHWCVESSRLAVPVVAARNPHSQRVAGPRHVPDAQRLDVIEVLIASYGAQALARVTARNERRHIGDQQANVIYPEPGD